MYCPPKKALVNKYLAFVLLFSFVTACAIKMDVSKESQLADKYPDEKSKPLSKNSIAYTQASVKKGKSLFIQHCASCHDNDGRARSAMISNATDLTAPSSWSYGDNDSDIFKTIHEGAGDNMPAFKYVISTDKDLWSLVNFVHSLRPDARAFETE